MFEISKPNQEFAEDSKYKNMKFSMTMKPPTSAAMVGHFCKIQQCLFIYATSIFTELECRLLSLNENINLLRIQQGKFLCKNICSTSIPKVMF